MKYKKGVKARLTIHEILYAIKYQNKSFDQLFDLKKESKAFETSDYKLIVDMYHIQQYNTVQKKLTRLELWQALQPYLKKFELADFCNSP